MLLRSPVRMPYTPFAGVPPEKFSIDTKTGDVFELREVSNHEAVHLIAQGWEIVR